MIGIIWHSRAFHAIISGIMAGLAVDLHNFLSFKSVEDATSYNYKLALLHAAQGMAAALVSQGLLASVGS